MKGPAATRVVVGIKALGMGCNVLAGAAELAVELVTVLSVRALLPSAVQPESAAAPATRPTNAAAFSAV